MRRIQGIGLVLSAWMLAACYAERTAEGADTSTSWLRECTAVADCDTGSDCVAGWCTEPSTHELPGPDASTGEPTDDELAALPDAMVESDTNAQPTAMPASFFEVSDVPLEYRVAVGWTGDRFLVSWLTHATEAGESQTLHLAHVSTTGEVEAHTRPSSTSWPTETELMPTAEGGVAVTHSDSGSGCTLAVFGAELEGPFFTTTFPCSGDGAQLIASPVPSSPDLLVAYSTGSYDGADQFRGAVTAGRCNGLTGEWMWMSEAGALALNDKVGVFAAGEDAVVVWGNGGGSTLQRASALAGPDPANTQDWSGLVALDAPTSSDSGYGLANLEDNAVLFSMDGSQLRAHVLAPDAEPVLHDVARSTISDRIPGVAAAPELGLAGVCYARGPGAFIGAPNDAEPDVETDSMWFMMVGADGTPASEPVMIAEGLADNTGCGVAWSGERFFVVTYGILPEVVDNSYTLTSIRGVLLDPAEL